MFNGIIQGLGTINRIEQSPSHRRLAIVWQLDQCREGTALSALQPGSSVAVNGACLTVVNKIADGVEVELSARTLDLSAFAHMDCGARVNLETALRMGQSIDGHLLSGHVDGVGQCRVLERNGEFTRFGLTIPQPLRKFIAENGALAIDGVSLTVNHTTEYGCTITVVPYTCAHTIFQDYLLKDGPDADGVPVNIEVDLLARYVHKSLSDVSEKTENNLPGAK